jgi:UV DNA damage endonuclease
MSIGYCCISIGVNEGRRKKDYVMVNRGMIKKTFIEKGLSYVSELVIKNLEDTLKILEYNISNSILVYRLSSDSFPWMSEYEFKDLPSFDVISTLLIKIGKFIKENNIRVSFHPGPFNVLSSDNDRVVKNTINELNKHAEILDMMSLEKSTYYPINIHVGSTKPTIEESSSRFCINFDNLNESCKKRLVIENDDSPNQFSVKNLYDMVHSNIGIPITFDQHHFIYGPQDQTMEDALKLAYSTWKTKPMTHMSSSRAIEDIGKLKTAHADFIYEEIQTFGLDFDTEIEAKAKDLAVIKYIKDFK